MSAGFKQRSRLTAYKLRNNYQHHVPIKKWIAAALFIYFLGMNAVLYRPDGSKRLADNALVALTLLIAKSRPEEKETIFKVIVNLINLKNE